jgi:hypothetical protein
VVAKTFAKNWDFRLAYITNERLIKIPQKSQNNFSCKICDYYTSSKKAYLKLFRTAKRHRLMKTNDVAYENPKKIPQDNQFLCACGKKYKHMSSLCKHKSKLRRVKRVFDKLIL